MPQRSEAAYIQLVLKTMLTKGWHVVSASDGEEEFNAPPDVMKILLSVDEASVTLSNGKVSGSIFIVFQGGNAGASEVINDYTITLDPDLRDICEGLEAEWA